MSEPALADYLATLPKENRDRFYETVDEDAAKELRWDWRFWARPNQLPPPGDWLTWLILSGRGAGKTRTGAEYVRANIDNIGRWGLIAPTASDAREVMVEGESGLLAVFPPSQPPDYEPSKRRVTFPNGAIATTYSAEEPDRLRGPQHGGIWADEAAAWKYANETWDMAQLGLRLGQRPRQIVTTTPRPIKLIRDLIADPTTVVSRGTTYENLKNLAPAFAAQVIRRYEGTTLGRQELLAEVLDEYPGAFWTRAMLDRNRVGEVKLDDLQRVVVGVDPAATAGEDADQTGIVAAGMGPDGTYYVLSAEGVRLSPHGWASRVLDVYDRWGADRIVAEINNGGEMVSSTLRHERSNLPITVIHASRGKTVRAEPVAALYEQDRVKHLGTLDALEDQQVAFPVASDLDDVVDAAVYALTDLAGGNYFDTSAAPMVGSLTQENPWAHS